MSSGNDRQLFVLSQADWLTLFFFRAALIFLNGIVQKREFVLDLPELFSTFRENQVTSLHKQVVI